MPGKPLVQTIDTTLSTEDENSTSTLEAVNLIKEKLYGRIKGMTCVDRSRKCRYTKYGETVASPTVSLYMLFAALVFDMHEGRDMVTFEVPGAFLHAETLKDKNVHEILR